jgi:V/A-type H+-transporting ATPase subunit D
MAILKINPTRMELIKLKRKLVTARRGHKLLKEKRDGLMKEFMMIIKEVKALRERIEKELGEGFKDFLFASALMSREEIEEALAVPAKKISLVAKTKNVMSVNVPEFKYSEEGGFLSYSLAMTSVRLDSSLKFFSETLKDLISLAQMEHSAKLMAAEIEKTRRRVNALEYVFIPDMAETIKYITAKLNEQERSSIIMVMKIKKEMEKQG